MFTTGERIGGLTVEEDGVAFMDKFLWGEGKSECEDFTPIRILLHTKISFV